MLNKRLSSLNKLKNTCGLPYSSDGKESGAMQEIQVSSLGQEDPLEKEMATHPVFLPRKFHGLRSLVGYSPWGRKDSDTTDRLHSLR